MVSLWCRQTVERTYGQVTTRISRMDRQPIFLTMGLRSRSMNITWIQKNGYLIQSEHREPTHSLCVTDCFFFMVNVFDLPFAWAIAIYWKTWQKRKPWLKSLWHPEFARVIFPQKIALLPFQASQEKCRKIHASSRTFRSKIRPKGPKLTLQEN